MSENQSDYGASFRMLVMFLSDNRRTDYQIGDYCSDTRGSKSDFVKDAEHIRKNIEGIENIEQAKLYLCALMESPPPVDKKSIDRTIERVRSIDKDNIDIKCARICERIK